MTMLTDLPRDFRYAARSLLRTPGFTIVAVAVLDGWDPNGLKLIASPIAARGGMVVGLVGAPSPVSLLIAASPDVNVDCAAVLKQVVATFGGKGGGRKDIAQGGGAVGDPQEIAAFLRRVMRGEA